MSKDFLESLSDLDLNVLVDMTNRVSDVIYSHSDDLVSDKDYCMAGVISLLAMELCNEKTRRLKEEGFIQHFDPA